MGRLSRVLADHELLEIDTSVIIYLLDAVQPYVPVVKELFDLIQEGHVQAIVSTITMLEVMVKPYQLEDQDAIELCQEFFETFPNLKVIDVTQTIATRAAQLRAETGLKAPDALIVATAMESGATAFLSNDSHFNSVEGLQALLVSDFVQEESKP